MTYRQLKQVRPPSGHPYELQIELSMKGGVNILRILNKVQIYGIAPTLTLVTSFDNSKDVQDPPELHVMFRGERQASVIKVEPMFPDEDDSQNHLTEHTQQETCEHLEAYSGVVTVTAMASQSTKSSKRINRKIPSKYSSDVYGEF